MCCMHVCECMCYDGAKTFGTWQKYCREQFAFYQVSEKIEACIQESLVESVPIKKICLDVLT